MNKIIEQMTEIYVLRMGHRYIRDLRISTHCGLVAWALGAKGILFTGMYDKEMMKKLKETVERWGGEFEIGYVENWREYILEERRRGTYIIHLTMYGINIPTVEKALQKILRWKRILVIIGAEKMPREVYLLAHLNVAIKNMPHSEVAALSIFMDRITNGKALLEYPEHMKIKIIPQIRGKVIERGEPKYIEGDINREV